MEGGRRGVGRAAGRRQRDPSRVEKAPIAAGAPGHFVNGCGGKENSAGGSALRPGITGRKDMPGEPEL